MTHEEQRLEESRAGRRDWKRWGPYLSERAWGTVREDYSPNGAYWEYFPHDHARSRAYRWNEDGLAGFCDRQQVICFALALWNGHDPILKERLFGLTSNEGRHGEDVKEYSFVVDCTPTHSYMQYLYKYPHAAFPYEQLIRENQKRTRDDPEFELLDTGVFDHDRYFDVVVEYAKAAPNDLLIRMTATNRSNRAARLDVLPTLWFRNTWAWGLDVRRPRLERGASISRAEVIEVSHFDLGNWRLLCKDPDELLFTENETNFARLFGVDNRTRWVKDGINDYLVRGRKDAVNPAQAGTKASARYRLTVDAGQAATVKLRFADRSLSEADVDPFGDAFDDVLASRKREANDFYASVAPPGLSDDARLVLRQSLAGLLWNKQFYHYDVKRWLRGDPAGPEAPRERLNGRNSGWTHLHSADVISMPDKWEFPWYAAWDLAFHCVPLALVDPEYAKDQVLLLVRERYMHPNGQLPSYEGSFGDVNPPVQAWAAWQVYQVEQTRWGRRDRVFLERIFHKLLLNFTWWVNRKDADGLNVFQGGFLGLDNIGVFDRSEMLPGGGALDQTDATSWMGMYCLNLMTIALELARENQAYEDVASKFLEHFVYIARAMNNIAGQGIKLWDETDGFYYDVVHPRRGRPFPVRVRSMVGLTPLFAVETLESELIDALPSFKRRLQWFIENQVEFADFIETRTTETNIRRFLSLVSRHRLRRVLARMLDEAEFLSPHGIRSLSRVHRAHPYTLRLNDAEYRVEYEPAESRTGWFGGNSNWRGPIWFPLNWLIIESLQKCHRFLGDGFQVEFPTGSGRCMNLWDISLDLQRRLTSIFMRDEQGPRPVHGRHEVFQQDPHWRDLLLFYEYFHGDNGRGLGACHQTGWTALVANMLQSAESTGRSG